MFTSLSTGICHILYNTLFKIMSSLLFIKNNSTPKIVVNLLKITRTFSQKYVASPSHLLSSALSKKSRLCYTETQLWRPHLIKRHNQTYNWGKNTNVANNVILYKIGSFKYFKIAHIFGICAVIWWMAQIWFLYKDRFFYHLWTESFEHFAQYNISSLAMLFFTTALGPIFYALLCLFSTRCIKYVILNKGGSHVSLITFHPLKSRRIITVPVEEVYCLHPRTDPLGTYTSIKIKSRKFNFLIDKSGTYVNPELFDHTVGWRT